MNKCVDVKVCWCEIVQVSCLCIVYLEYVLCIVTKILIV